MAAAEATWGKTPIVSPRFAGSGPMYPLSTMLGIPVISAGGTVLRYGQFYGPGTYHENDPPPPPRIHIDDAARRTMSFLAGRPGIFTITEDEPAS